MIIIYVFLLFLLMSFLHQIGASIIEEILIYFLILAYQFYLTKEYKNKTKNIEKLTSDNELSLQKNIEEIQYDNLEELKNIESNLKETLLSKQNLIEDLIVKEGHLKNTLKLQNKEKINLEKINNNKIIELPTLSDEVALPSFLSNHNQKSSFTNQTSLVQELQKNSANINMINNNIQIKEEKISRYKGMDLLKNKEIINFFSSEQDNSIYIKERFFNFILEENEISFIKNNLNRLKKHLLSKNNIKLLGNQDDIYIYIHDKSSMFRNYSIQHKEFGLLGYIPQNIAKNLDLFLYRSVKLEADWMINERIESIDIRNPFTSNQPMLEVEIELRVYWEDKNEY